MNFTKVYSILFLLITTSVFSQDSLKVNQKAPKINITNLILNKPNNFNLDKKFIVLEFWATWCAPCLAAVPHLNELKKTFEKNQNIYFISLTNEKTETVKRTLNKIDFKTIVATDETKNTLENYKIEGIPQTVVIDDKGFVKWTGMPDELNDKIISNILNNVPIITHNLNQVEKQNDNSESELDKAYDILLDKKIENHFSLKNIEKMNSKTSIINFGKGKFMVFGVKLYDLFAILNEKASNEIEIPSEFKDTNFNILYKNVSLKNKEQIVNEIKQKILSSLRLVETKDNKILDVYNLSVIDKKKLQPSLLKSDASSHNGENDTHLIFSNTKIDNLKKILENELRISILDQTSDDGKYDFLLQRGTVKSYSNQLFEYGLKLEKNKKEIPVYSYKIKM